MKILKVTLKNLNSLVGEHTIDFTKEPLRSAGIFAITGSTGAGKSTILDAITLALYGRAARYGNNPRPTDMMSRHTGEASAEVVFEVSKGEYRAEWQLRRSRGKKDGKLQAPKRYVYDAAGQVLAEQVKEAGILIETLSGLDYDRFLRSVLLAQGDFSRFLKASDNERAELLESLTGTTIYSELSKLAHDEKVRRERELGEKERALDMIEVLTDEERIERKAELDGFVEQEKVERAKLNQLTETIILSKELRDNLSKRARLKEAKINLSKRIDESKGDLEKLTLHRQGGTLFPLLDRFDATYAERLKRSQRLAETRSLAEKAQSARTTAIGQVLAMTDIKLLALEERKTQLEQLRLDHEKEKSGVETWLEAHRVDAQLDIALPEIVQQLTEMRGLCDQREAQAQSLLGLEKEQSNLREEVEKLTGVVAEARAKLATTEEAEGGNLEEQIETLRTRRTILEQLRHLNELRSREVTKWDSITKRIQQLEKAVLGCQVEIKRYTEQEVEADKLVKAHQKLVEAELKIARFESHRANLVEGEACPLCGATDHPYADHSPVSSEAESNLKVSQKALADIQEKRTKGVLRQTKVKADLEGELRQKNEIETEVAQIETQVREIATANGISENDSQSLTGLLKADEIKVNRLMKAQDEWVAARHGLEKAIQAEGNARKNLDQLSGRISGQQKSAQDLVVKIEKVEEKCRLTLRPFSLKLDETAQRVLEERRSAFAEKSSVRQALVEKVNETAEQLAETDRSRGKVTEFRERFLGQEIQATTANPDWKKLSQADEEIRSLERNAEALSTLVQEQASEEQAASKSHVTTEKELNDALQHSNFADVEELRIARLDPTQEQSLVKLEKELNEEAQRLEMGLEAASESIARLKAMKTAEGDELTQLESQKTELENSLQTITGQRATLDEVLRRDQTDRERLEKSIKLLADEKSILSRWEILHRMIGSADGKKFRRFAQAISLDALIRRANNHMSRLTDRYLLRRTQDRELELEIIDLFQASTTRPMSSLSGGETFLASLALALGLSDLAGRNVQIDSLFIDEGFGSLDPETLDIAIAALERLQSNNKTVGVISHVGLLKERISTQISVWKIAGGTSKLKIS